MYLSRSSFGIINIGLFFLNKSLLTESDVKDFELESHTVVACNIPPLNDHVNNREALKELIEELKLESN